MKKQRYFIHAIILDEKGSPIGHSSSVLELNPNSTKEFNVSLKAREMVGRWNTDDKRKADGVSAIIASFNKI